MKPKTLFLTFASVFVVGAALAGIFRTPAEETAAAPIAASGGVVPAQEKTSGEWTSQPLVDEQGAVEIAVTPLNLNNPGETLDFQVSMNTHSVELGMDLAELATLTTDTGLSVQAITWDAQMGGHHVGGTVSFPAEVDGVSLFENAGSLTLKIVDVDAPERTFTWEK